MQHAPLHASSAQHKRSAKRATQRQLPAREIRDTTVLSGFKAEIHSPPDHILRVVFDSLHIAAHHRSSSFLSSSRSSASDHTKVHCRCPFRRLLYNRSRTRRSSIVHLSFVFHRARSLHFIRLPAASAFHRLIPKPTASSASLLLCFHANIDATGLEQLVIWLYKARSALCAGH